jgi:hypothetical protein
MGNTNASSKIFERLDKDGNGIVNLSELVDHPDPSDVTSVCSLPILYHFDFNKKGMLNFKEWSEMERFVQRVQKKVKTQKPHTEEFIYKVRRESLDQPRNESTNGSQDKGDVVPANKLSPLHEKSNSSVPMCSPKKEGLRRVASDDDLAKQKEIKKQVNIALLPSLHKEMYDHEGRQNFLEWLFKLVRVEVLV